MTLRGFSKLGVSVVLCESTDDATEANLKVFYRLFFIFCLDSSKEIKLRPFQEMHFVAFGTSLTCKLF